MKVKHIVVTRENGDKLNFFFPKILDTGILLEYITAIRIGDNGRWVREFRNLPIAITEEARAVFDSEMKYIVLGDKNKPEFEDLMFIFPKYIDHDRFMEVMQMAMLEQENIGGENYSPTNIMSAGFVWDWGTCHGRSETLKIESRKKDTALYKKWFD